MGKPSKSKPVKEEIKEDTTEVIEDEEQGEGVDFMELLNSPLAKGLLGDCKNLLKKDTPDSNTLEITIKGPSESVLKLFNVPEEK